MWQLLQKDVRIASGAAVCHFSASGGLLRKRGGAASRVRLLSEPSLCQQHIPFSG